MKRYSIYTPWIVLGGVLFFSACSQKYGRYPIEAMTEVGSFNDQVLFDEDVVDLGGEALVQSLLQSRKYSWANFSLSDAKKVAQRQGESAYVSFLLADYYYHMGQYDKALSLLETEGVDELPQLQVDDLKAQIYSEIGEYAMAIDLINSAILINRGSARLYGQKAEVYLKMSDSLSAIAYYEKAWELDSTAVDVPLRMAQLYAGVKEFDRAIAWLDRVKVDNLEVKKVKIETLRSQGNDARANVLLAEMLATGDLQSGEELMAYFTEVRQLDSVLYYSTRILERDSTNLPALFGKAEVFDTKGYFSSSLRYYESVLEIDSLNEEALDGVRKVNGKIAYLRKIKEQKESIPSFDFAPKSTKTLDDE
ncbi:hypothetical protein BFP72_05910 [Reichenbachiella sp. 5M10]|uniref:tetratricopeptide repeat protein n=1 Tax=Reichenbachiella sp. 5M10 TaxID=1889772 RepID=UPI000C158B87|nr:tetratricopeptide repeat protein [Reichenbachiella sp. 5M10]PIB34959.1 hypothetical protein BFP72_05910 [Reichenbachiella sp. 5M10]